MDASSNRSAATQADEEEDARRRLAEVPGFSREVVNTAGLTRLVGFTNRVYRVDVDGRSVCLRIPGDGAAAARSTGAPRR